MTIFDLINSLKKISSLQPNIRSCGEGNIYDFYNANPSIEYGTFFITQGQHKSTEMFDEYQLTLFYVDRLADDYSNKIEIQSTGKEALENIIGLFVEEFDAECGEVQYQPFTERFADLTAGVYANVTLGMERTTVCAEDFNGQHAGAHIFEINNQSKKEEFTKNGDYVVTYDKGVGYTGLEEVRIKVNLPFEEKTIQISENGQTVVTPSEDFEGMDKVTINTDVSGKIDPRQIVDIYEDGVTEVDPNEGQYGIAGATITVNTQGKIDPRKVIEINEDGVTELDPQEGQYGIKGATITVDTQGKIDPVREETYIKNGTYQVRPEKGQYGIAGADIDVAIPFEEKTIQVNENGQTVVVPSDNIEGITKVVINTDISSKIDPVKSETYIKNGTYQVRPEKGQYGIAGADIDVAIPFEEKTIQVNENGQTVVVPSDNIEGITKVTINTDVSSKIDPVKSETYIKNGTYQVRPEKGQYGIKGAEINVNVHPILQNKTVVENGIVNADEGWDGLNEVNVQVPIPTFKTEEKTITITSNGKQTVTPSSDFDGLSKVDIDVNVEGKKFTTEEKTVSITKNGQTIIEKSTDKDGMTKVIANVDVPQAKLEENKAIRVIENGTTIVSPSLGFDGLKQAEITVDVPSKEPVTEPLKVIENGIYTPSLGIDGYNRVEVNVPTGGGGCNLGTLKATENKTYTPTDLDGWNSVEVNVPFPALEDKKTIQISENGKKLIYPSDGFEGMKLTEVDVNIPLEDKQVTISENGTKTYYPSKNGGFKKFVVNTQVPLPTVTTKYIQDNGVYNATDGMLWNSVEVNVQPRLQEKTVYKNGTVVPDTGYYGLSKLNVNVPQSKLEDTRTKTITENGFTIINPSFGFDAMKQTEVTVNVKPKLQSKTATENGRIIPDWDYDGLSEVNVNVQPKLQEKTVSENGEVVADTQYDGLSKVIVNVPKKKIQPSTTVDITSNGTTKITPDFGYDGIAGAAVNVKIPLEERTVQISENGQTTLVPSSNFEGMNKVTITTDVQPKLQSKTATENGRIIPDWDYDGLSEVNVNVQPKLQEKTAVENGNVYPDVGYNGLSKVTVNVPPQKPVLETVYVNYTENGFFRVEKPSSADGILFVDVNVDVPQGGKDLNFNGTGYDKYRRNDVTDDIQADLNYTKLKYDRWQDRQDKTSIANFVDNDYQLVYAPSVDTSLVTSFERMFFNDKYLIYSPVINGENVTSFAQMFYMCKNLKKGVEIHNTNKVETLRGMYSGCERMKKSKRYDVPNCWDISQMYFGCSSLDWCPEIDCTKVTKTDDIFYGCRELRSVDGFKNLKVSIDLSPCIFLLKSSVMLIINKLGQADPNYEAEPRLTLDNSVFTQLTEADIAGATSKGWQVISA